MKTKQLNKIRFSLNRSTGKTIVENESNQI